MMTAKYIYSILKNDKVIMWRWGFHSPHALQDDKGLIFHVEGFKHRGLVKVCYLDGKDLFSVQLLNNKGVELHRIEDVYFDELVKVIDDAVERTSDYYDRIKKQYKN